MEPSGELVEASSVDRPPHGSAEEPVEADRDNFAEESAAVSFAFDTSKIRSVPDDERADDLRGLGVSVYNQTDLERGVLDRVERAVAEEEKRKKERELADVRKEMADASQKLRRIATTLQTGTRAQQASRIAVVGLDDVRREREKTVAVLQSLEAKERALLAKTEPRAGGSDLSEDESAGEEETVDLEHMFGQKETEEDRLVRTGHMTPFGTLQNRTANSERPGPSKPTFVADGPRKRKKKEKLGTKISKSFGRISGRKATTAHDDLLDAEFREDPETSDRGDASSDEEYRPDAEDLLDSEEDSAEVFEVGKEEEETSPTKKRKKSRDVNVSQRSKKSPEKLADDGDPKAYARRMRDYRRQRLEKKHRRIMESDDPCVVDDGEESSVEVDEEFRVPSDIWNKLYRYQQTGVRWLWELHRQNCGGIVGDEMGLGKTIQLIAFLAGLRHSGVRTLGDSYEGLGPVMLVCPTTVMHQWVREFHQWYPPLRVAILHPSGSYSGKTESLVRQIDEDCGVLIASYAGVSNYAPVLLSRSWHYVVLDEGHKIRNPDARTTLTCKQFRTTHRIVLSGSPIQNNLRELWSLFDFVYPGKLGTLPVFMEQFAVPITQGGYSNASDVQVQTAYKCASLLRDTIKPYLLRRMKEDVKCHLQLPGKNEQVLFCSLTDHQRDLYREYLASPEIARIVDGRYQIFVGLINLRKICNHPDLYDGGPKIFANSDPSASSDESRYGHPSRSGKMAVVQSLLQLWKRQGHRVLLFTQSKQMLTILEDFVKRQGYTYIVMSGSTPIGSRQPAVHRFNTDPSIFLFLLTTRVGGLGVNLTGADRVVIYDPDWNPSTDTQARERAWRIGQLRDVTVYRLLTAGTIEEKIYHRQIFKQFLTNRVLKDPRQRRFFKTNDLHELFSLGDDPKRKKTETGTIFAGTGSEVKPVLKTKERDKPKPKTRDGPRAKPDPEDLPRPKPVHIPVVANVDESTKGGREPLNDAEDELSTGHGGTVQECTERERAKNPIRAGSEIKEEPTANGIAEEEGPVQSPEAVPTDEKIARMRELAKKLSRQIAEAGFKPKTRQDETGKMRSVPKGGRERSRKKSSKNVVEGERIDFVVKQSVYRPEAEERQQRELNAKQDDYVLRKLFKKSGVHSAMRHDVIVDSADPDYLLVEGEAERVAKEAIRKLKRSRRQCLGATSGVPTWTGSSGASGAPPDVKLRFGQKKVPTPLASVVEASTAKSPQTKRFKSSAFAKTFAQESAETSGDAVPSSSDLLARMKLRARAASDEEEGAENVPTTSTTEGRRTERDELLEDLRNFVAFGAAVDGVATTREVLDAFSDRVRTAGGAPVFKALLSKICEFYRREDGEGAWRLRPEFR